MDTRVNSSFGKAVECEGRSSLDKAVGYILNTVFGRASNDDNSHLPFNKAFDRLIREIECATARKGLTLDLAEPDIRHSFKKFLRSQDYRFATKNFEKLLDEKSGKDFKRNDGTINWFHEFVPILTVMSLIRDNTISMKAVDRYGGLETAICSHLRHDSVEDNPDYVNDKVAFRAEQLQMLHDIKQENPSYLEDRGFEQLEQMLVNIGLITQRKHEAANGVRIKEDVEDYTERMVTSPVANPLVFMLKQVDGIHNFATMWAPKFAPERRLKRCNEREDMYGRRLGYVEEAKKNWPDFAKGIEILDDTMGMMLYVHFRYLESVDLHYKKPRNTPVGIGVYMPKAMSHFLPEEVDMKHIFVKNLMNSVDPMQAPEKYGRLQHFIEKNVQPPFEPYRQFFPYFFKNRDQGQAPSSPTVAM
jgi:hypothetical protein